MQITDIRGINVQLTELTPTHSWCEGIRVVHDGDCPGGGGPGGDGGGWILVTGCSPRLPVTSLLPLLVTLLVFGAGTLLSVTRVIILGRLCGVLVKKFVSYIRQKKKLCSFYCKILPLECC